MTSWEDMAADRSSWRERRLEAGEEQIQTLAEEKRARRKQAQVRQTQQTRFGLSSNSRRCASRESTTASNWGRIIHGRDRPTEAIRLNAQLL